MGAGGSGRPAKYTALYADIDAMAVKDVVESTEACKASVQAYLSRMKVYGKSFHSFRVNEALWIVRIT